MEGYEKNYNTDMNNETSETGNKKRKKQVKAPKKREGKIILATVCIVTAFVVFVVLLVVKDRIINGGETTNVVVATREVPRGTILTEQNMANYFAIEQRDVEEVPVGITYENARGMVGKTTDRTIHAKEIVTTECFVIESYLDDIEDPVILALDLGSLGQTVAGTLRAGDVVDIRAIIRVDSSQNAIRNPDGGLLEMGEYPGGLLNITPVESVESTQTGTSQSSPVEAADSDVVVLDEQGNVVSGKEVDLSYGFTGEYVSQLLAKEVRIVNVFTSGGEKSDVVEASGSTMVATVVNIAVPASMVDSILIAQEEGKITLVKVDAQRRAEADAVTTNTQQ